MQFNYGRPIANLNINSFSKIQTYDEIEKQLKDYLPFKNETIKFLDKTWCFSINPTGENFYFKSAKIPEILHHLTRMMLVIMVYRHNYKIKTLLTKKDNIRFLLKFLIGINFPIKCFDENAKNKFIEKIETSKMTRKSKYDQLRILKFWNENNLYFPHFLRIHINRIQDPHFTDIQKTLTRGQEGNPAIDERVFYWLYGQSLNYIDTHHERTINDLKKKKTLPKNKGLNKLRVLIGACSAVILSATGIRKNELLSLREDCVIKQNGLYSLRFFESKINEGYFIKPINEHIAKSVEVLKKIKALLNKSSDKNDYLFGYKFYRKNNYPTLSDTEFRTIFNTFLDFFHLTSYGISPHQFRSTHATNIYRKTKDEFVALLLVFYALKHTRISMSLRYIKTNIEEIKKIVKENAETKSDQETKFLGYSEINYPYKIDKNFIMERENEVISTPYCLCLNFNKNCFFYKNFQLEYFEKLKTTQDIFYPNTNSMRCINIERENQE